jgi:hypothetical protein
MTSRSLLSLLFLITTACGADGNNGVESADTLSNKPIEGDHFQVVGQLESRKLNEASGLQMLSNGDFVLHNDEGISLYIIDDTGKHRGRILIKESKNKDWEDITRVPGEDGPFIVIGDTGDNKKSRKNVRLYFLPEPAPDKETGQYPEALTYTHRTKIRYPDGPRDVEAISYEPSSNMILLLSKRDLPPRLYGVPLDRALAEKELVAEFLGEVPNFRPPTRSDILKSPTRGLWASQPTGMDISPDGRIAAVLTYRSLYIFRRGPEQSWAEAFQGDPVEYIGPPGLRDEAVSFNLDQTSVYVTTERRPAPIHRLDLPQQDTAPD